MSSLFAKAALETLLPAYLQRNGVDKRCSRGAMAEGSERNKETWPSGSAELHSFEPLDQCLVAARTNCFDDRFYHFSKVETSLPNSPKYL